MHLCTICTGNRPIMMPIDSNKIETLLIDSRFCGKEHLLFSVVIPTYNRPKQLASCLQSLNQQALPYEEWEVIVVDDGGKDNTESLVNKLFLDCTVRLFRQQNSGPAKARNLGAQNASGDYLAFLDDDCEADKEWLLKLKEIAEPGILFGGKTLNKLKENIFSEASQVLIDYLYEAFAGSNQMFFTSNNFVVDRQSFIECGAFNTEFDRAAGEDREFSIRYNHQGYELQYVPTILVSHSHKLDIRSFFGQHFNYGFSSYVFRKLMQRQQIPLSNKRFFYTKLLLYPLQIKKYGILKRCTLVVLLLLTQLSYTSASLLEIFRRGIRGDA